MIHAIYFKTRPKSNWLLFSTTISEVKAKEEIEIAKKKLESEGLDKGEVASLQYESMYFIPQMLKSVTHSEPEFN